ncbi:MAG: polysaccharide export protein [Prolixibacteraceae bacterium]|nr:polysaccharide export protein [Prolixibacteraceae bacterium]MBN2774882.1 polysaccharide export protein [Prolixibacteraceae bacterium]
MKRINFIISVFILATLFSSCRLSRDLAYFQDIEQEQSLFGVPEKVPEYRIRPLDNLYVSILTQDPEVNQLYNPSQGADNYFSGTQQMSAGLPSQYINGYQVEPDGSITFSILGTIPVAGLTLIEAQNRIKSKALEFLEDPMVKVKILSFKVNVTGEVRNPGLFYNYQGKLTVLDAISMANGITDYAKVNKVHVIRQEKFSTKTYNLDLTSKKVFESEAFYLQPDDLVYVPPGKFKNTGMNSQNLSVTLSALSTVLIAISYFLR